MLKTKISQKLNTGDNIIPKLITTKFWMQLVSNFAKYWKFSISVHTYGENLMKSEFYEICNIIRIFSNPQLQTR